MTDVPYLTHVQWPQAVGFPDGVESLSQFREALEFLKPLPERAVFRGEARFFETHCSPGLVRDWEGPLIPARNGSNLLARELEEIRRFRRRHLLLVRHAGWRGPAWVALAQHYGARTRLVDVTFDEKVALFFASWSPASPPADATEDGWVYLFQRDAFRPMDRPRGDVGRRDIQQGVPDTFMQLFEPWPGSPVYEGVGHLFQPTGTRSFNKRMSAQHGAFVWWQPPHGPNPMQVMPIRVKGASKLRLLEELDDRGVSVDALFPDGFGRTQRDKANAGQH